MEVVVPDETWLVQEVLGELLIEAAVLNTVLEEAADGHVGDRGDVEAIAGVGCVLGRCLELFDDGQESLALRHAGVGAVPERFVGAAVAEEVVALGNISNDEVGCGAVKFVALVKDVGSDADCHIRIRGSVLKAVCISKPANSGEDRHRGLDVPGRGTDKHGVKTGWVRFDLADALTATG